MRSGTTCHWEVVYRIKVQLIWWYIYGLKYPLTNFTDGCSMDLEMRIREALTYIYVYRSHYLHP
jgi:hypothetical protein